MKQLIILGNSYEWCGTSLSGLKKKPNVIFINGIPVRNRLEYIAKILLSDKAQKYLPYAIRVPVYHEILKNLCSSGNNIHKDQEICIMVYDGNRIGNQADFFRFLRKRFKKVKLAYIFTNIVKITEASGRGYVEKLNEWYDAVFAFDPYDAVKYNFAYSPLIYDAESDYNKSEKESTENLVFYVGQAKDRLEMLLACHAKIRKLGIECDFHIANVPEEKVTASTGIVFNQFMTYENAVQSIQKATCLLDAIQGDSTGLTIKVCEAVCYNKKLITTNIHVKQYPFYDPRYIRVIESAEDIDEAFFTENRDVQYPASGRDYFSADGFWNRLWAELEK